MTTARSLVAIWVSKFVVVALHLFGRSATSLPGFLAGRISPRLVHVLLGQLQVCVLVTGTNGKTTTSELLHAFIATPDEPWLINRGGANLLQGLLATLLQATDWRGRLTLRRAVLEVDEATLPLIARSARPRLVVVTNVLRDQLDRYGEIDLTLALLRSGLSDPSITLVTCADDPLCAALAVDREGVIYFGAEKMQAGSFSAGHEVRDGAFCLNCGHELQYDYFFYGQLGRYHCTGCSFAQPEPDLSFHLIEAVDTCSVAVTERIRQGEDVEYAIPTPLPGLYNAYNVLAAVSAARTLGVSPARLTQAIAQFQAPTGRMQVFAGQPQRVLALIKNPTGANSVLRAISDSGKPVQICFAINDQDADGRDVSWLWDMDVEGFLARVDCAKFACAGTRAADMALRLAYAGVARDRITLLSSLDEAASIGDGSTETVYVLSTYTALHPLAQRLRQSAPAQLVISEESLR